MRTTQFSKTKGTFSNQQSCDAALAGADFEDPHFIRDFSRFLSHTYLLHISRLILLNVTELDIPQNLSRLESLNSIEVNRSTPTDALVSEVRL